MPEEISSSEKIVGFDEIRGDPNFIWILLGGLLWLLGTYAWLLAPPMITAGFALTCSASAVTAQKRSIANAWPAMLAGGIIYMIGLYIAILVPIIGGLIAPFFTVPGGVMIIFFAIPLALQRGEVPVVKDLQERFDSKDEKEKPEATETEADSESSE
ncbi:MAG: hypothetical protein ACW97A_13050 [Candidatus Thorarchaeota archaeon]|jgi:hypothetical protein